MSRAPFAATMTNARLLCLGLCVFAHAVHAQPAVKVMAFNVLFKGADDAKSIKAIADESPDVVCLTEVTPAFVKRFESSLKKDYPHRHFEPRAGTWGLGFASKRPLRNVQTWAVAPARLPAMEATVAIDGHDARFVCVHLMPPAVKYKKDDSLFTTLEKNAAVRSKQADTLVSRFAKSKAPVVLLGDFNEEPGGDALRKLEKAGWVRLREGEHRVFRHVSRARGAVARRLHHRPRPRPRALLRGREDGAGRRKRPLSGDRHAEARSLKCLATSLNHGGFQPHPCTSNETWARPQPLR